MSSNTVYEIVKREVENQWTVTNAHGCDLRQCLVTPELREYDDCGFSRPVVDPPPVILLWLVLEEVPDNRSGYKIVYGEQAGMFGLAVPATPRDIFLGYYGSFMDAYLGM